MSNKSWKERMRKHWKKELLLFVLNWGLALWVAISFIQDGFTFVEYTLFEKIVFVLWVMSILWQVLFINISHIRERIDKYKREAAEEEEKTEEK